MGLRKPAPETVLGHSIPEPRITRGAWWWGISRVAVPVAIIGSVFDLIVQWVFGICVGLWCMVG